jgi:hypothetical protein
MLPKRMIISSHKLFEYCKNRYPTRLVEACAYVPCDDDFYVITNTNKVRIVRNKTELWVLGSECPNIEYRR